MKNHIDFIEIFTTEKTRKNINDYNLQQIKVGLIFRIYINEYK